MLTVHSNDGIHYTGTYGKKGGKIYGNYHADTRTFTGIWHKKSKNVPLKEKEHLTGVRLNILSTQVRPLSRVFGGTVQYHQLINGAVH